MLQDLPALILSNRPNLSQSSVNTYNSTLKNLYFAVYPEDKVNQHFDITKFYNYDDFIKHFSHIPINKRKSTLSALLALCSTPEQAEPYRKLLHEDIKVYNDEQLQQTKSTNEMKNWISQAQIKEVFDNYKVASMKMLKSNEQINESNYLSKLFEIQYIQNFIILCLTSGVFIPPRRSVDWSSMVFRGDNVNENENIYTNQKKNSKFIFNVYKTVKSFHHQEFEVPVELNNILQLWVKFISGFYHGNYLLFDINENKLSPVKLNQRLNAVFGKKISINILRHSYISEKYLNKPMPALSDLIEVSNAMAHSPLTHLKYIKK